MTAYWIFASWWLFTDFEQLKKINSHFSDFEQVKKSNSHFAN